MENRKRHIFYVAALFITDILGAITILNGGSARLFAFTDKVSAYFTTDGIGRYFMIFVMLLYTVACFYSFEYMKMEERENVFFAFYFVCFGAMLAVCLAGNLVTLYLCFEMATLTSMPLVLHEMTKAAVSAALKYLFYSIGGALLGLLAVFFVTYFSADPGAFAQGGTLDMAKVAGNEKLLLAMVFSFAKISEVNSELSDIEAKISAANARKAKLTLMLEEKNNLDLIEQLAIDEYHMIKEGSAQKKYITLSEGDSIVLEADEETSGAGFTGGMLSAVTAVFDDLYDYIK
jgi:hypothetical protein